MNSIEKWVKFNDKLIKPYLSFSEISGRGESPTEMSTTGTLKSSRSELDLDRPNIEDYLPSGVTIQQEPHGKLCLYVSSAFCVLQLLFIWILKSSGLKKRSSFWFSLFCWSMEFLVVQVFLSLSFFSKNS